MEMKSRLNEFYYSYQPASEKHRQFHLCGKKIRILTGAPRTGKTTAAIQDVAYCLLGEHPVYKMAVPNIWWVIVPKFHKIYESGGMFDKYLAVLPKNRIGHITKDRNDNIYEIELDNKSLVLFKSQEQGVDSVTSNAVHGVLADERIDNHDIRIQLRARIIDEDGLLVYTQDRLEDDEWVDDLRGKPYVFIQSLELRDNSKYLPKEELERLEYELDEVDKERIFYGNYKDRDTLNVYPKELFNDKNYLPIQPARYELIAGEMVESELGQLKIYKQPKPEVQYVMAWDVAEGVGGNAHAVQVFDEYGEQCAVWLNNTVDYNLLDSTVLIPLGLYYNTALGVGELRSFGYSVMGNMMKSYPHLYVDVQNRRIKQIAKQKHLRFGVVTDEVNKGDMANLLYSDLKQAKLLLHDEYTVIQLQHFVQTLKSDTQKKNAVKYHGTRIKGIPDLKKSDDDLVMALLFADRALNAWDYLKPRIPDKVATIDDIAKKKREIFRQSEDTDSWYMT